MAFGRNHYQARWREVETTTTLDLKVLWGYDSPIANPPSHELGIDKDDVLSLYIVRRQDGFKENVYVLQLLQVQQ